MKYLSFFYEARWFLALLAVSCALDIALWVLAPETLEWVRVGSRVASIFAFGGLGLKLWSAVIQSQLRLLERQVADNISCRSALTRLSFAHRLGVVFFALLVIGALSLVIPGLRSLGIGLMGSAGILGVAAGVAAQPIVLNILSGIQLALTKTIRIGDRVAIAHEKGKIEEIWLTHAVVCTQDLRRIILPLSKFVNEPFENWDLNGPSLDGAVLLYCSPAVPMEALRAFYENLLRSDPLFDGRTHKVEMTGCREYAVEISFWLSASDASHLAALKARVREKLISFLHQNYPEALLESSFVRHQFK
jgi:hypothetical protein